MTINAAAARAVATALGMICVLSTPAAADYRDVLHHCEDVLAHDAATTAGSTRSPADTSEVERCKIVIRESALRDSRMTVDENGKKLR